jgi:hypothetical protein
MMVVTLPSADWNETEYCRNLRQTFDAYAAQHAGEPTKGTRFRWRGGSTITDAELGNLSRTYDLTVLSRPGIRLADHGIAATEKTLGARGQRPGEVILAEARAQGADLLIKGAYTQSRFRQMIFGGATQHVLAAAELPVFLAH